MSGETSSWDNYVSQLTDDLGFKDVCMMGKDGTVWASTAGFTPQGDPGARESDSEAASDSEQAVSEVVMLQKTVLEGSVRELRFNGQRFMLLRRDYYDSMAGTLFTAHGLQAGDKFLLIVSTELAYVVATSMGALRQRHNALCAMAEHLLNHGI